MDETVEAPRTAPPVMVMPGIGMVCRCRKLICGEGVNALNSAVVNIALAAIAGFAVPAAAGV